MKVNKLLVYPNAYALIHRLQGVEDGVSWAGLFPLEPDPDGPVAVHGQAPRYVGAKAGTVTPVRAEKTMTVKGRTAVTAFAVHDVAYEYIGPVEVPNTPYYQQAVCANDSTGHSSLIAADVATARACGLNEKQFVDPLILLEQLRHEAIQRFALNNTEITEEELQALLPPVFELPKASFEAKALCMKLNPVVDLEAAPVALNGLPPGKPKTLVVSETSTPSQATKGDKA